jgi:hypothetical protein
MESKAGAPFTFAAAHGVLRALSRTCTTPAGNCPAGPNRSEEHAHHQTHWNDRRDAGNRHRRHPGLRLPGRLCPMRRLLALNGRWNRATGCFSQLRRSFPRNSQGAAEPKPHLSIRLVAAEMPHFRGEGHWLGGLGRISTAPTGMAVPPSRLGSMISKVAMQGPQDATKTIIGRPESAKRLAQRDPCEIS